MANYFYDKETDTLYVSENDGFGWLGFLFVLAAPFIIIAVWLKQYATFVNSHSFLSCIVFLLFAAFVSLLHYRRRRTQHRLLGFIAVVVSLLPVYLAQTMYAIPYILSHDGPLEIAFEWMIVTFLTVGLTFFLNQICLLFKNGLTHLIAASLYLILTWIIL